MITITKSISSCLSNRIVPCIYLWSDTCSTSCRILYKQTVEHMHHRNP